LIGDLVDTLCCLGAKPVLIQAAHRGLIKELKCSFEDCRCPDGREFFETKASRRLWAPSADRFPVPGRDGGEYVPDNVRLVHFSCNAMDGGRVGGKISKPTLTRDQRAAGGRNSHGHGTLTHEQHVAAGKASAAARTPEQHAAFGRSRQGATYEYKPRESTAASVAAMWARMTPEERAARGAAISAGRRKRVVAA